MSASYVLSNYASKVAGLVSLFALSPSISTLYGPEGLGTFFAVSAAYWAVISFDFGTSILALRRLPNAGSVNEEMKFLSKRLIKLIGAEFAIILFLFLFLAILGRETDYIFLLMLSAATGVMAQPINLIGIERLVRSGGTKHNLCVSASQALPAAFAGFTVFLGFTLYSVCIAYLLSAMVYNTIYIVTMLRIYFVGAFELASPSQGSRRRHRSILKSSIAPSLLQITGIAIGPMQPVIAVSLYGPRDAAIYFIFFRLFSSVPLLVTPFVQLYSIQIAGKPPDYDRAKLTVVQSIACIFTACTFLVIAFELAGNSLVKNISVGTIDEELMAYSSFFFAITACTFSLSGFAAAQANVKGAYKEHLVIFVSGTFISWIIAYTFRVQLSYISLPIGQIIGVGLAYTLLWLHLKTRS